LFVAAMDVGGEYASLT